MKLVAFGGKGPNDTAVGVSVDANGKMNTKKTWESEEVVFPVMEIRDTNAHTTVSTPCYCGDTAMVSIRFTNSLKDSESASISPQMVLYRDDNASGTDYMKDANGDTLIFNVPAGTCMLTPDDLPALKYIQYLKIRIQTTVVPASGSLTIKAYLKR